MSTFLLAVPSTLTSSSIAAVSRASVVRHVVVDNVMLHSKHSLWGQASTASLVHFVGERSYISHDDGWEDSSVSALSGMVPCQATVSLSPPFNPQVALCLSQHRYVKECQQPISAVNNGTMATQSPQTWSKNVQQLA